jgi:hypothetical protein
MAASVRRCIRCTCGTTLYLRKCQLSNVIGLRPICALIRVHRSLHRDSVIRCGAPLQTGARNSQSCREWLISPEALYSEKTRQTRQFAAKLLTAFVNSMSGRFSRAALFRHENPTLRGNFAIPTFSTSVISRENLSEGITLLACGESSVARSAFKRECGLHSCLSAVNGSTRVARQAGRQHAKNPTANSNTTTAPSVIGS